jgi:hypothetical protein
VLNVTLVRLPSWRSRQRGLRPVTLVGVRVEGQCDDDDCWQLLQRFTAHNTKSLLQHILILPETCYGGITLKVLLFLRLPSHSQSARFNHYDFLANPWKSRCKRNMNYYNSEPKFFCLLFNDRQREITLVHYLLNNTAQFYCRPCGATP